jgi:hypothetical protein
MLRFVEIGLFLAPFALYVAWRLAGARAPTKLVVAAALVLVVVGGGLAWFGLSSHLPAGSAYVPAELQGGARTGPGHGS